MMRSRQFFVACCAITILIFIYLRIAQQDVTGNYQVYAYMHTHARAHTHACRGLLFCLLHPAALVQLHLINCFRAQQATEISLLRTCCAPCCAHLGNQLSC